MAAEILEEHGMGFDVMLPLIDETARKVHQLHPLQAQTGPAVRYDENVIRHQAQLLQSHPVMKDLYERMSLHIHRKAGNQ
jgi:carbonic anhydrase